ncbi:MAG: LytR/AlgR family response regulator transcription factor [Peptostreptococcaceae bacterium]
MRAIIIEDEKLILRDLQEIIEGCAQKIEIVKTFRNGVDPIKYIQDNDVDVMFIDINIPLLDGMSLAKTVNKFEVKPYIVFITAHKNYAADAFEIQAFDYVLKPYNKSRIEGIVANIEKLGVRNTEQQIIDDLKITIKDKNAILIKNSEDIYYLKADEKYTYIYTDEEKYKVNHNIAEVEEQLPEEMFFRCHRSYIVNINKIKSIESSGMSSYKLRLLDIEDEVLVSRRKIKELKSIMNII